jgi:serine-type D-Ala-D-Ala carboxypeptidase (penicillin-binding protein 5/6)
VVVVLLAGIVLVPRVRAQTLEPPPPTPVPVPGGGTSPSPFPSVLRTPPPATEPPEIYAGAAVLIDLETGRTLYAADANERRPIASLTKIMTAYLVMTRTSPDDVVLVSETTGRTVGVSNLGLVAGERIRVQELLYALMLQSANDAALALAEHVGGSIETFVEMMNREAARLGLSRTSFTSANGLDDDGYSTARDMALLTRIAYDVPGFADIVSTRVHAIRSRGAEPRIVQNRNALLWLYPGATGVKTGFTTPAGFCIVATAVHADERVLAVVLGEPAEAFSDAAALMNFGFAAFDRQSLIEEGRSLGIVDVDGRDVAVAAGESLNGLVVAGSTVRPHADVDPGVRFPPGRGEVIGVVRLSATSTELGTVPLVVVDVAPPPPPGDGPWWVRAAGSVARAGGALVDAFFG